MSAMEKLEQASGILARQLEEQLPEDFAEERCGVPLIAFTAPLSWSQTYLIQGNKCKRALLRVIGQGRSAPSGPMA